MAIKYNRQATNKYYGAANAGYVRTGSASDGLAKALASASQSVAIGENLRINNKKDKAIEKIQALEASGKTLEVIQGEILAGKHPDLTGKYIDATTQFHSGKIKAAEVIEQMTKAMKTDYDITKDNLNDFSKQFLPDMEGQDSSFMAGFGSFYNVWKNKADVADAKERGEIASQNKIDEVRQVLSVIPNEDLDTRYVEEWKSFGTALRTGDNTELTKFYTNAELMEAIRQDVASIIDTADSLEDIERAEKIMSLNLGKGTNGQELGSLNSRKNQNTDVLKAALTAKKDAVIQKERRDEQYNTSKATQAVWVEAFTPNEDGKPKSALQIQDLLKRITVASKGDVGTIEAFTQHFNSDPKSRMIKDYKGSQDFLLSISMGEFDSHKEMMKAMVEEGIPDDLWAKANTRWDRYQKSNADGAIPPIYDTDHHYVKTKDIILKTVAENYTVSDDGTGTKQAAQSDVLRYVNFEIEEQEARWEAEGLDVTPKMRKDFILEVQDYVNKTWTGNDEDKFKAPETLTMENERARIIEEERLEAEEIAKQEKQEETNNTVVFQRGGEPVTLKQFSNEIVENLNNIDAPKLIETVIGGIIDEDRKFELQTQPKIKKYINEVLGAEFDADILSALSDDDFDLISETITKKLNLPFSDDNTENLDMIQDLIFSLYNLEG
ncbi:hypothetical protein Jormungand_gp27 [Pelagibacter phage Jormungand EXVC012P]|nr:hypothetical protein Jormungand_gp27 [Pelagibacter phage Jormungand EXVC012P]QLF88512.1 hypothetical protein Ran_gp5 [Pelagibacter phage Ran EXVC014P]